jgi:hypothetical protein
MLSLPQPGQTLIDATIPSNYKVLKDNALKFGLDGSCDEKALVVPHLAVEFDHLLSFIHPTK